MSQDPAGNKKLLASLVVGHSIHDFFQALLAPLIPILMGTFGISATQAGFLAFFLRGPSIIQPVIGNFADRRDFRWAVILAPLVTAVSMSLVVLTSNYLLVLILLVLSGLASASWHAIGPAIVGNISDGHLGRNLGIFVFGGEIGRTLGPIIFVQTIALLTIEGSPWLISLGVFGTGVVFMALRKHKKHTGDVTAESPPVREVLPSLVKVLTPFALLSIAQLMAITAMTLYLPAYLVEKGESLAFGASMLAILQVGGLGGAYLGGWLSDSIGRRSTIFITIVGTTTFMLAFLFSQSWYHYPILMLFGVFGLSEGPVIMAYIQEFFTENRSLANGAYMAVNFAMQAIAAVMVGFLMDQITTQTTFIVCAIIPLAGVPLLLFLPKPKLRERLAA
jgi:MFS transporter, FSR family, fosmidomycin resistance protein